MCSPRLDPALRHISDPWEASIITQGAGGHISAQLPQSPSREDATDDPQAWSAVSIPNLLSANLWSGGPPAITLEREVSGPLMTVCRGVPTAHLGVMRFQGPLAALLGTLSCFWLILSHSLLALVV